MIALMQQGGGSHVAAPHPPQPAQPWVPGGRHRDTDGGMVTAEAATAAPVVVLVLLALAGIVASCATWAQAHDLAVVRARALARGEAPPATALAGATVATTWTTDTVRVQVRRPVPLVVRLPGAARALHLTADATAALEPGVVGRSGVRAEWSQQTTTRSVTGGAR